MLVVRKEGKAHDRYNSFRSAFELLESVGHQPNDSFKELQEDLPTLQRLEQHINNLMSDMHQRMQSKVDGVKADMQQQINELKAEKGSMQQQINELKAEKGSMQQQINDLKSRLDKLQLLDVDL